MIHSGQLGPWYGTIIFFFIFYSILQPHVRKDADYLPHMLLRISEEKKVWGGLLAIGIQTLDAWQGSRTTSVQRCLDQCINLKIAIQWIHSGRSHDKNLWNLEVKKAIMKKPEGSEDWVWAVCRPSWLSHIHESAKNFELLRIPGISRSVDWTHWHIPVCLLDSLGDGQAKGTVRGMWQFWIIQIVKRFETCPCFGKPTS